MPRLTRKLPSYRIHKPSGRAVVTLDDRVHYLGAFGTPESRAEYDRLISEWLAGGRRRSGPSDQFAGVGSPQGLTLNELMVSFLRHADRHYRLLNGKPSKELANFRDTFRPLKQLYGHTIACQFSPLNLKALRNSMIESRLCRNTINQRVGRIVHVFKWAASEELIPASVHQALKTVSGLQRGRTEARESKPIKPVPDSFVDAIRLFVPRQVWAMVEVQRLTGMRPGEVCLMKTGDIDMSGSVWVSSASDHKMSYQGREQRVYIGPRAQVVLKPWLKDDPSAFLFSPAEARAERYAAMRKVRRTPVQPSQLNRRKVGGKRRPGLHYTAATYYQAIRSACKRAKVPHWHPNQLRHNAATWLRREFGLDVARVILGHSSPVVTEVYAELDREKALAVMEKVG